MAGSILRILFGFVVACIVAGLVTVLFVITPSELYALPEDKMMDQIESVGILSLVAGTQSAVFSAPFALVAALIGEWQRLRGWLYYGLVGMLISGAGFLAQSVSETTGQPTIVNTYALAAFLAAGLIGGLAYWLTAGKWAGAGSSVAADRNGDRGPDRQAAKAV